MENKIPLLVLDMRKSGNLLRAIMGEEIGSQIVAE
jgi:uridylate kinase